MGTFARILRDREDRSRFLQRRQGLLVPPVEEQVTVDETKEPVVGEPSVHTEQMSPIAAASGIAPGDDAQTAQTSEAAVGTVMSPGVIPGATSAVSPAAGSTITPAEPFVTPLVAPAVDPVVMSVGTPNVEPTPQGTNIPGTSVAAGVPPGPASTGTSALPAGETRAAASEVLATETAVGEKTNSLVPGSQMQSAVPGDGTNSAMPGIETPIGLPKTGGLDVPLGAETPSEVPGTGTSIGTPDATGTSAVSDTRVTGLEATGIASNGSEMVASVTRMGTSGSMVGPSKTAVEPEMTPSETPGLPEGRTKLTSDGATSGIPETVMATPTPVGVSDTSGAVEKASDGGAMGVITGTVIVTATGAETSIQNDGQPKSLTAVVEPGKTINSSLGAVSSTATLGIVTSSASSGSVVPGATLTSVGAGETEMPNTTVTGPTTKTGTADQVFPIATSTAESARPMAPTSSNSAVLEITTSDATTTGPDSGEYTTLTIDKFLTSSLIAAPTTSAAVSTDTTGSSITETLEPAGKLISQAIGAVLMSCHAVSTVIANTGISATSDVLETTATAQVAPISDAAGATTVTPIATTAIDSNSPSSVTASPTSTGETATTAQVTSTGDEAGATSATPVATTAIESDTLSSVTPLPTTTQGTASKSAIEGVVTTTAANESKTDSPLRGATSSSGTLSVWAVWRLLIL